MEKYVQRRDILVGLGTSLCFLSGCVGDQESDGEVCTYPAEDSFETDHIETITYSGDDTDEGFRISTDVEINPSEIDGIVVYNEKGSEIDDFDVVDEETEINWDIDGRPTNKTFELVAYNDGEEIDRSVVQADCD